MPILLLLISLIVLTVACGGSSSDDGSIPESQAPIQIGHVETTEVATLAPFGINRMAIPSPDAISVNVSPMPCGASDLALSESWVSTLSVNNFSTCVRPFGVLIAAEHGVPDRYIAQAARIVAEILDPDMDGTPNDSRVAALVADYETSWIPMPADMSRWHAGGVERQLNETLESYGIALPRWWMLGESGFGDGEPDKRAVAVMVEEIVHFMTQFGYSPAYPAIFGVSDWDSLLAKETRLASCGWWQHPENDCPGNPGHEGDCSMPSCDVTEFYHQVLVTRAGMEPAWTGWGFPDTREALEAKLSPALKRVMDNPQYHQINEPLRLSYPYRTEGQSRVDIQSQPKDLPSPSVDSSQTRSAKPETASVVDPLQQELDGFRRAISENVGPGCNVWSDVPCPRFEGFVKTEPNIKNIPNYQQSHCDGSFNDQEYKFEGTNEPYIACLIDLSRTDQKPYLVSGARFAPGLREAIAEALGYGIELFGGWGPMLVTLVRYGEPDVEYVAAQTCLYMEAYGGRDYDRCYAYNHLYYQSFDDCCGAVHGTPEPLAPVRVQTLTFSAPESMGETLRKITLHEYVHVWQSAHVVHPYSTRCSDEENSLCELGNGPLWMEEGTAEYLANLYAGRRGWIDFRSAMEEGLSDSKRVFDRWGFTLKDSHSRSAKDRLDQHQCGCGGAVMYSMGMWGVAWLVDRSGSNDSLIKEFYPRVAYEGYETAFKNAFGLTLSEFYDDFGKWYASTPRTLKLEILDRIANY